MVKLISSFSIAIIIILLLTQCASVQLSENTQNVLLKASAIKLGSRIAEKNPDIIPKAKLFEVMFLNIKGNQKIELCRMATNYINEKIKDPIDKIIFEELVNSLEVEFQLPESNIDIKKLDSIITGFLLGVELSNLGE